MVQVLILIFVVAFIVLATIKLRLHLFLSLLLGAFLAAIAYRLPAVDITRVIGDGFGGVLGYIGLVILLGTVIGVILERSGAAITMAETVIRLLGQRSPTLTMSVIGYLVSIPVFCDSAYVILNSLKNSIARRLKVSNCSMSVALATGLFATHTLVPPTPGPVAAATNLGLEHKFGALILMGALVAAVAALVGWLWSRRFADVHLPVDDVCEREEHYQRLIDSYGKLPSPASAFAPILAPIVLICLGSIAALPARPFGDGSYPHQIIAFLGQPMIALLIGLAFACRLLPGSGKCQQLSTHLKSGITAAAPIMLITGAGGALGAVLKASGVGTLLGQFLSYLGAGLFVPFLIAAALKSAQGSSTVAMITTSALLVPMLPDLGLSSEPGRVLAVLAMGAGAMTVSHVNDSYFWVVTQFSKMGLGLGYRAQTAATLLQGMSAMAVVSILGLILL